MIRIENMLAVEVTPSSMLFYLKGWSAAIFSSSKLLLYHVYKVQWWVCLEVFVGILQNLDRGLWTGPWTGLWTEVVTTIASQLLRLFISDC